MYAFSVSSCVRSWLDQRMTKEKKSAQLASEKPHYHVWRSLREWLRAYQEY
jgi:hypothetical protein